MSKVDFKVLKSLILEKKYEQYNEHDYKISIDKDALNSLSQIFLFLSFVFRYPSNEVYNNIADNIQHFKFLFDEYLTNTPKLPNLEDLEPEYVSLFIAKPGGIPAPLYASVYTDDEQLLLRDSTIKLKEIMTDCGFEINKDLNELEDNLFIILEFIYAVMQIILTKELMQKEILEKLYCIFVAVYEYLDKFVRDFSSKVRENETLGYFGQLALLLEEIINDMDDIFYEILEWEYN
jgi:TorA maturation chaperone TorD